VAATPVLAERLGTSCRVKIVDVGANPIDGPAPYAPMLAAKSAEVVGFEPNPAALARLNEKKGPLEIYLPHALGTARATLSTSAPPRA
jgi:hypothetical protein